MNVVHLDEIQSVLNTVAAKVSREGRVARTLAIKEALCSLAKGRGCEACTSVQGIGARWGEWLYDLVWLQTDPQDKTHTPDVLDSPLVVECEWGDDWDILADFQKLLLARADARLMIYQAAGDGAGQVIATRLKKQVNVYRRGVPGDRYILACFCNDTREFECQEYVKAAPVESGPRS